eukprot:3938930-Amphidinium_carterae.2
MASSPLTLLIVKLKVGQTSMPCISVVELPLFACCGDSGSLEVLSACCMKGCWKKPRRTPITRASLLLCYNVRLNLHGAVYSSESSVHTSSDQHDTADGAVTQYGFPAGHSLSAGDGPEQDHPHTLAGCLGKCTVQTDSGEEWERVLLLPLPVLISVWMRPSVVPFLCLSS